VKPFLLDLNVILDVLLERRPGVEAASALWAAIESGQGRGMIPAHGFTTIFYLLERARDTSFARNGVERLTGVFGVASVNAAVIRRAVILGWADFEDAVCAIAAEESDCGAIVTRNPEDYPNAPLPIMDPAAALIRILAESEGAPSSS
jgi:predicted nucleic acid-binding protein